MKKLFLLILMTAINSVGNLHSQSTISAAQAVFVYNFTRLIEWPESYKTGDFVIGVYGSSDILGELEKYTGGKKVGLQNIVVKKFKEIEDITKCQILFISYGKSGKIADVLSKIAGNSTLIITEKEGMIKNGAIINFILDGERLKFELKSSNAQKIGIKINSKLENMAIASN